MDNLKGQLICLLPFIIGCFIGALAAYKDYQINNNKLIQPDTIYNKVVIDSIEYNIIRKDTIIYNLKHKMKDEVTKSFELDDSSAVKLFKELASEKC